MFPTQELADIGSRGPAPTRPGPAQSLAPLQDRDDSVARCHDQPFDARDPP